MGSDALAALLDREHEFGRGLRAHVSDNLHRKKKLAMASLVLNSHFSCKSGILIQGGVWKGALSPERLEKTSVGAHVHMRGMPEDQVQAHF